MSTAAMIAKYCCLALIASSLVNVAVAHSGNGDNLQLHPENVQDASKSDGNADRKAGQTPSLT